MLTAVFPGCFKGEEYGWRDTVGNKLYDFQMSRSVILKRFFFFFAQRAQSLESLSGIDT